MKKILICLLFMSIVMSGCSQNKVEQADKDAKILDSKMTEDLLKEKEVLEGEIYTENKEAFGVIIIKEEANSQDGKAVAEKYAGFLKKKYGDVSKITVQAVQKDQNIAYLCYTNL